MDRRFVWRCGVVVLLLVSADVMLVGGCSASACTSVCLAGPDHVVFGNNLDWFIDDALLVINKRNVRKRGAWGDDPPEWISKYGSITTNPRGNGFPNRGMNEAGLVVGEMWLGATVYPDPDARPFVEIAQWIQYQLDTCATVAEVLATDKVLRIDKDGYKSHFLVCDATGACAAVEWLDGKLCSHTGDVLKVKALVNSPYADCLARGDDPSGRFAKAASLLEDYASDEPVEYVFSILRATRQNHTCWHLVFDVRNLRLHYVTQRNPVVRSVCLRDFDLSCDEPTRILDINAHGTGDVAGRFVPFAHEENARIARATLQKWAARHGAASQEEVETTLNYHLTMECVPTTKDVTETDIDTR